MVGWVPKPGYELNHGKADAPTQLVGDEPSMIETPDPDIRRTPRNPRDERRAGAMRLDVGHELIRQYPGRGSTRTQLQRKDEIARGPLVGPRGRKQIHMRDRLGSFGGAEGAPAVIAHPRLPSATSETLRRAGKLRDRSKHPLKLMSGCDRSRPFFPAFQVGTLLGGELVDAHTHGLELQPRYLFVDVHGYLVNRLLKRVRVLDDPLARESLVRE